MFLKLMKHELYAAGRVLLPLFGGLLLAAGLARGSIWVTAESQSDILNLLGGFLIAVFVLGCLATIILTVVLLMLRFARSVHGDEAYLTHTLPVGVHGILLSRLLSSFLWLVCAFAAMYLGFRICTAGIKPLDQAGRFFRFLLDQSGIDPDRLLLEGLLLGLVSSLSGILQAFAAISIGHSFNSGKTGKSVVCFFVLTAASSLITNLLNLLASNTLFQSLEQKPGLLLDATSLWSLGTGLLFCGLYYFLTWFTVKKRLNLG
ncbi:MAG: hypothetical protein IKS05_08395 [Oscillospiraceae bacterium]|nr:hypothetical protein [Oscillospiraceae bacterium]